MRGVRAAREALTAPAPRRWACVPDGHGARLPADARGGPLRRDHHLSVAGLLWVRFGFAAGGALFLYAVVGAVAVGAVPAAIFAARGLVAPALIVGGAFAASATPPAPVGPTPFGWYLLGWVAVAAGGVEAAIRRCEGRPTGPESA